MTHAIEQTKITGRQLFAILVLMRLVPITIAFPFVHALVYIQHAWIVWIVGCLIAALPLLLLTKLGQASPSCSIIEYIECYLGPIVGKIMGALLTLYCFVVAVQVARALGDAFVTSTMPSTPTVVFVVALTLVSSYAARQGIEVIARLGEIVLVFALVSTAMIAVMPYDQMRFERFLPLFPGKISDFHAPLVDIESFYCQFIVLGLLVPHLDRPKKASYFTMWAVLVSGLVTLLVVASLTAVLGSNAINSALPTLRLAQMISLGEFIERIEPIVMLLWTWVTAVKLGAFVWATSVATKQVLGLQTHHHLVYPYGALAAVFSTVFFPGEIAFRRYLEQTWAPFSVAVVLVILATATLSYAIGRLTRSRQETRPQP